MATPVYSTDPTTGQAVWTLPGGNPTPPTTGAGGSPASGSSWVAPAVAPLTGSSYVQSPTAGFPTGYTGSQPTLQSYLQQQMPSYESAWAAEHGTAQKSINDLLLSSGQNYLAMNPGVGDPTQLANLVSQLGGQYSDWLSQYNQYLVNQGPNIAGLAPSVQAAVAAAQPTPSPITPGGFIGNPGNPAPTTPVTGATAAFTAAMTPSSGLQPLPAGNNPITGAPNTTGQIPGTTSNPAAVTDLSQLVYSPHAPAGSPASTPNVFRGPGPISAPLAAPATPAIPGSPGVSNMLTRSVAPSPATSVTPGTTPGATTGTTPDQALASGALDMNALRQIVANGGNPVDVLPAWQAMIAAQQQNINRGTQQLKEQFGASGNRFSTGFGTSLADFVNQAQLQQNSQLSQAQLQALTDAANRQFGGAQAMFGAGQAGLQQLSSQRFQAAMQATNNNLSAALALLQTGYGAAGQIAGAQTTAGLTAAQQYTQLLQMGLSSAQALAAINQGNLQLGAGLGAQQQTIAQQAIDRQVQQYMQGLPQYNPMMSFFAQGANTYPQLFNQQFPVSQLGSILGAVGSLLGASPAILATIQQIVQGMQGQPQTINSQGGLGTGGLPAPPTPPTIDWSTIAPSGTISLAQIQQLFGG